VCLPASVDGAVKVDMGRAPAKGALSLTERKSRLAQAARNLVVVESPTKARTLERMLGPDYKVEASFGHIRDLPKSKMGVNLKTFVPEYIVPDDSEKHARTLRREAKAADHVWLATDLDREGEAIAWHLADIIKVPKSKLRRVTFHEITPAAIDEAFKHPREIDQDLVNAQQARRVVDRLVGYTMSPLLWKKIRYGLSAGRVQSVALRLIVDREREIQAFVAQEYWTLEAALEDHAGHITYMRTDSLHVAEGALRQAHDVIASEFGVPYALERPRHYKTRSKGAQEAHEAIRPTDLARTPDRVKRFLKPDQLKLYTLIWQRTIASQMASARFE